MKQTLKRLLSASLALVLLCSLLPVSALAAAPTSGKCGDNAYWAFDAATKTLTISGTGALWGGYGNENDEGWNAYLQNWEGDEPHAETLVIEKGITEIGAATFLGARMNHVTLPEGLLVIGSNAFGMCSGLKEITLPQSLTEISDGAFHGTSLTSIDIPANVKTIGDGAFHLGASPEEQTLKTVTLHEGLQSIGEMAFCMCPISEIDLPDSVSYMGDGVFWGTDLTDVTIPQKMNVIGDGVFRGAYNLERIVIHDGVTKIGDNVFGECKYLSEVCFTGTKAQWDAIEIGEDNDYLTALTPVFNYGQEPESNPSGKCGDNAYWEYDAATKTLTISGTGDMWDYDTVISGQQLWFDCGFITTIIIKEGITSIGDGAFLMHGQLKTVSIPNGVKTVGDSAFYSCESLESVTFPDSVTSIGDSAFEYCFGLKDVKLSKNLTSIGEGAFFWCSGLTTLEFPAGLTSIGHSAFYNCEELTKVTIPDSITFIGPYAFNGCKSLSEVCYTGSKEQWNSIEGIDEVMEDFEEYGTVVHFGQEPESNPTSGQCGDNAHWEYDAATKTLTISGTGAIEDYGYVWLEENSPPTWISPAWEELSEHILCIDIQ